MFIRYNPNPYASRVGDCAVRAMCKALNKPWEEAYIDMCLYGLLCCDMPTANIVWGRYLHDNGFVKELIPYEEPHCTLESFANSHPDGIYVVVLNGHVVTIEDGCIYDTWDSSQELPIYYWRKK